MLYRSTHAGREPPERRVPIDILCDFLHPKSEHHSNKSGTADMRLRGGHPALNLVNTRQQQAWPLVA